MEKQKTANEINPELVEKEGRSAPSFKRISYWILEFKCGRTDVLNAERTQASADKVLATIFWEADGIIFIDYLQKGKTINGVYYANLIHRLRQELLKKRRGKITRGVLLHQDNAPPHTSQGCHRRIGLWINRSSPHSLDMAPSDYYLFPNLKKYLRGKRFYANSEVIRCVNEHFEGKVKGYFRGVLKLQSRCDKCIEVEWQYIEK